MAQGGKGVEVVSGGWAWLALGKLSGTFLGHAIIDMTCRRQRNAEPANRASVTSGGSLPHSTVVDGGVSFLTLITPLSRFTTSAITPALTLGNARNL